MKSTKEDIESALLLADNYKYGSNTIQTYINISEFQQLYEIAESHNVPLNAMAKYLVNSKFKFAIRLRPRCRNKPIVLSVDDSMYEAIRKVMEHYNMSMSKFVYKILTDSENIPYRFRVTKNRFGNGLKRHKIAMYVDQSQLSMFTCLNYTKKEMRETIVSRLSR